MRSFVLMSLCAGSWGQLPQQAAPVAENQTEISNEMKNKFMQAYVPFGEVPVGVAEHNDTYNADGSQTNATKAYYRALFTSAYGSQNGSVGQHYEGQYAGRYAQYADSFMPSKAGNASQADADYAKAYEPSRSAGDLKDYYVKKFVPASYVSAAEANSSTSEDRPSADDVAKAPGNGSAANASAALLAALPLDVLNGSASQRGHRGNSSQFAGNLSGTADLDSSAHEQTRDSKKYEEKYAGKYLKKYAEKYLDKYSGSFQKYMHKYTGNRSSANASASASLSEAVAQPTGAWFLPLCAAAGALVPLSLTLRRQRSEEEEAEGFHELA